MPSRKSLWCCFLPALAAAVFAVTGAVAADLSAPPSSCTTNGAGYWSISASGPTYGLCKGDSTGDCTKIVYTLTKNAGAPNTTTQAVTLVRGDTTLISPSPSEASAPCAGDNLTGLGFLDCSAQAVRLNSFSETNNKTEFVVAGKKTGITSTIALRANKVQEACAIVGFSYTPLIDPKAAVTTTEYITFEGCTVAFEKSAVTGEILDAWTTEESLAKGCTDVQINDLSELKIYLEGELLETPTFAEGQISTGENSCSTRLIGGKLYTVCTP